MVFARSPDYPIIEIIRIPTGSQSKIFPVPDNKRLVEANRTEKIGELETVQTAKVAEFHDVDSAFA